jgi:type I restriction enzyme R subunit
MPTYTEQKFEDHIEQELNQSDYQSLLSTDYDKSLCLVKQEVIDFIQSTQQKTLDKLAQQYGNQTQDKLIHRIHNQISSRGLLDVLRNGVKDRGCTFQLTYFQPASGLNPQHQQLYSANQFSLVRQLHYSSKNQNSLDMVLFLNGLPLLTMELKNSITGQNVVNAEKQYRQDRDPKEPLFQFKRCLVHFAVGNEKVSMTTHLQGSNTRFFPFNKGIDNPINPNGHKSSYLWEDILQPDNLLDLIDNFIHQQETTDRVYDDKTQQVKLEKNQVLIFPRYHQLDVIRKIKSAVVNEGVGGNYLIQHTTGSGKSNSIAWLAHLLTHLFQSKQDTDRIFDSIIVVTDRRILDKQLQDTIKQLERVSGVVHPVIKDSNQLRQFLSSGKDIIITTIQKFNVIAESMQELKSKTFAVIIDEVHSSQSGESAKNLKMSLSKGVKNGVEEELTDEIEDMDAKILQLIEFRGKQDHISYFGFSGTPKNKTLELFGRQNDAGHFTAFHLYSMQQSIAEGFTLDVLQNYTTYQRYFKLVKNVEDDKEYEESRTRRTLLNFVDLHPHSIQQKTEIILDHFQQQTHKSILGKGRAMLVTPSRLHCVRYKLEFDRQMKNLPYQSLVAFSGTVHDTDNGKDYTENSMNELPFQTSVADSFKDPRYRILIVANKFQTGFDEPNLQTMYVDKKLNGLQCVQTLSRLNRVTKGKTDTLVLDFVNDPIEVQNSFQQYFQTTVLEEATDPNRLYQLQTQLSDYDLYDDDTINQFCSIFYDLKQPDELLQGILDQVIEEWRKLEEQREEFRSYLQSYIRLYAYIAQLITFQEPDWEKLYAFARCLNKKLPKREHADISDVLDAVDLDSIRRQMVYEQLQIELDPKKGGVTDSISSGTSVATEPELDLLSNILQTLNDAYQTDFTEEDKVDLDVIRQKIQQDQDLRLVVDGDNTDSNKRFKFDQVLDNILLEFVTNKLELYTKLSKPNVKSFLQDQLYNDYIVSKKAPH